MFFFTKSKAKQEPPQYNRTDDSGDFGYLQDNAYYFDSACQTLRPKGVIDAELEYYTQFNSCGGRVKYKWGEKTDKLVSQTRQKLLKMVGKKDSHYFVSFNLNTTSGINYILQQLKPDGIKSIVTSEIEHNSVFLPSMVVARKHNLPRIVLPREPDGALIYKTEQLDSAVVIVNTMSNIDGRQLQNLRQLAQDVKKSGGLLLLDSCQTLGHNPELLKDIEFDAVFGSGHKMYGPSVGFVVAKKSLLERLEYSWIGGSTVSGVSIDSYELLSGDSAFARLEPGLQNYAGIIGLGRAIDWLDNYKSDEGWSRQSKESDLSQYLYQRLSEIEGITLTNNNPSAIVSLYSNKIDSHQLGLYLAERNIMCRTGYHCCHYYLLEKSKLPPLFRISLGLHNSRADIDFLIDSLKIILNS